MHRAMPAYPAWSLFPPVYFKVHQAAAPNHIFCCLHSFYTLLKAFVNKYVISFISSNQAILPLFFVIFLFFLRVINLVKFVVFFEDVLPPAVYRARRNIFNKLIYILPHV